VLTLGFVLAAEAETREVTLLYTNDIESVYEPVEAFWNPEIELIGGNPYLATLIDQVREHEALSFLFDAGDIYTGALSALLAQRKLKAIGKSPATTQAQIA
jgi:5'-nucleotidase/UDP-sugar diphosphatase